MADAGIRANVAVGIDEGRIIAVGALTDVERELSELERGSRDYQGPAEYIDCAGRVLTPGLVDSHTHAVFGRPRYDEQELRAAGAGYMEIARKGGGIHSSVRDLRTRSEDDLLALTRARLERLARYGATTVEIKSGYGLSLEDELK
ncbi:MAG TPA: hypothetical protein VN717_04570, partial [Gemmatimonadaceae bacterium]|nr:hypothetical protein [Gemmatimonadaceae bacterium]